VGGDAVDECVPCHFTKTSAGQSRTVADLAHFRSTPFRPQVGCVDTLARATR
jgi:hypothetical protein